MAADVNSRPAGRASLREEQSRLTRLRILDAARRLFVGRAYSTVSMQEIAREAGVAYQTVFSQFGSKLQLALELCASEFPHVGPTVAMLAQARDAQAPDAWVRLLGIFARRLYEPCAEILRFMRESGDPALVSRFKEIQAGRLQLLADLGPQLEKARRLPAAMTAQAAVDLAWTMTSPATYELLVLDRGWSPDQFEEWLSAALTTLLLAD